VIFRLVISRPPPLADGSNNRHEGSKKRWTTPAALRAVAAVDVWQALPLCPGTRFERSLALLKTRRFAPWDRTA